MDVRQSFVHDLLPFLPHPLALFGPNRILFLVCSDYIEICIHTSWTICRDSRLISLIFLISLLYEYPQFLQIEGFWKKLKLNTIEWFLEPFSIHVS